MLEELSSPSTIRICLPTQFLPIQIDRAPNFKILIEFPFLYIYTYGWLSLIAPTLAAAFESPAKNAYEIRKLVNLRAAARRAFVCDFCWISLKFQGVHFEWRASQLTEAKIHLLVAGSYPIF